jgi:hypothetical protein
MPTDGNTPGPQAPAGGDDLVYINGIDALSGKYVFPPRPIGELARQLLKTPVVDAFTELHADEPRSFGVTFAVDPTKLEDAGWGIVFHEDTPPDVRAALDPLIQRRKQQAKDRFKLLDYKKGEQVRDWYQRHDISAGNVDPEIMPYYLLLVGPPDLIPFDFQYLIGVEYATGRLAFDTAAEYEKYARSVVEYETANSVPNAKEIAFWGTQHPQDPATNMSASMLITPLANGLPGASGALKRPINVDAGYTRTLKLGDDATKANLLEILHAANPPAMLFTASHGMGMPAGRPTQIPTQGALLCQDWPGLGSIGPNYYLAASDIDDEANVHGLIALVFACFGGGTPDMDQFPMKLSDAGTAAPLAPKPFVAALPRRLLTHPKGSALAVIAHVDRAWAFSIQAPKTQDAQIGAFRNSVGLILTGVPVGHSVCGNFGARFAALSTALASATSPTALAGTRPSDRDLVSFWLQRNDAQNYVVLGDPAVRIRVNDLRSPQ